MGAGLTLKVNPQIAELLHGEENFIITSIEQALGKRITIYPERRFHLEEFDILETLKP